MCKKILYVVLLAIGLNGLVFADDFDSDADDYNDVDFNPGVYLGVQAGTANMHYSGSSYTKAGSGYDTTYKFAGRGFIGYAFSQFISLELGYDYYGRPKFEHVSGNTQEILQQGLDLVVKASLPLDYGFALYLKGGMAWVHRSALHPTTSNYFVNKDTNDKFAPVGALGVNYWFAPNIAIDLCWSKTVSVSDLPTIDFFTAGLIYRINI